MKRTIIVATIVFALSACNNGAEDTKGTATDTVPVPADNTTHSSDARGSDNNAGILDTPPLVGKEDSVLNRSDTTRMTN